MRLKHLNFIVLNYILNDDDPISADLNNDGNTNVLDVIILVNMILDR